MARYKGIKGRAWAMLSAYIRKRDKGVCITCGRPAQGKNYHAGHFIPMGVCGSNNKLGWDEDNIYGQCMNCNKWRGGWGERFAEVLIKRFGKKFVEKLRARRYKYDPVEDWQKLLDYYKEKLRQLELKT